MASEARGGWSRSLLAGTGLAMVVAATGCSAVTEGDDSVTLVMADLFPGAHPVGGGGQPFVAHIEEHGPEVGLELDYYGPGELGSPDELPTLLRTGSIDIGIVIPSLVPEDLWLTGIGDLPALGDDVCEVSRTLVSMLQPGGELFEQELQEHGAQALWGFMISDFEVMTTSPRIAEPEDASGLLLRTPGVAGDAVIRGLGASPVSLPTGEIYEAVARGTVSGLVTSKYVTRAYGMEDEIRFSTLGARLGSQTGYYAIRPEVMEDLTPEQRLVLEDASEIGQQGACEAVAQADEEAVEVLTEGGVEFVEIAGDQRDEWDQVLTGIQQEWVDAASIRNEDAADILDDLLARLDEETLND